MSIVRSLLISIGFVNDKKAINETNKAITGFKTRFALVATTAAYAFKVVKNFFSDIASATLDSEELSRALGISLDDLIALQKAAQNFRIRPDQFSGVLSNLQKDLNEFRQGFGRLPELARQMGIQISREMNVITLFDKIIEKIEEIEDEQERIRVASNIFGSELGARISDLSQDVNGFKGSVTEFNKELSKTPNIVPALKSYEEAVNHLSTAFDSMVRHIGQYVFPVLETLFRYLEYVSKFYETLFSGDFSGFMKITSEGSQKIDSVLGSVGNAFKKVHDWALPLVTFNPDEQRKDNFQGYKVGFIRSLESAGWVNNIENRVEINMPSGTTQEQTQYLGTQIERLISDSINATFQDIQYNNPVIE